MATIVSIHSFRGGTGKSNMTANLATLLAASGRRVAVIDTDIQSPGIHVLFGLAGDVVAASLNDLRSPRSGPAQGRGCVWLPCGGGAAASDEMMQLASEGIFALRYPDHPMTALFEQVARELVA